MPKPPRGNSLLPATRVSYAGERRFNEAAREYAAAIRLKPDFAQVHLDLARVLVTQGDTARASKNCERPPRDRIRRSRKSPLRPYGDWDNNRADPQLEKQTPLEVTKAPIAVEQSRETYVATKSTA